MPQQTLQPKIFQCQALETVPNIYGGYDCDSWIEVQPQPSVIEELNSLSPQQTWEILALTAANFASAWLWKQLSLFAKRK